jgi:flagellar biosynthesis/type III secretory pathway protein FliH
MRYVTSFEQRGIQQGLEQGLQQGLEQGLQQGLEQGLQQGALQQAQEAVVKILQTRFTKVPQRLIKQIQLLQKRDQLSQLLEAAILVNSLKEFEAHLGND